MSAFLKYPEAQPALTSIQRRYRLRRMVRRIVRDVGVGVVLAVIAGATWYAAVHGVEYFL